MDKKWESVTVVFNDGDNITIYSRDIERYGKVKPILTAFEEMSYIRDKLNRLFNKGGE